MMPLTSVARSAALFVAAGLAEIGGGYLIWRSVRNGAGLPVALAGGALLVLYGVIPTLQPTTFGRTYAAYGGVFIVLSLLWGWWIDHTRPDTPDMLGAVVCIAGVGIIMYWPRS
jgi:small multidrug resistance family-3 protein